MLALSGVLPARNRWLPERGERRRASDLAAHTTRWLACGVLVQVQDVCAASDDATPQRTAGDSDTTAAHRPMERGRDWLAPTAPASPDRLPPRQALASLPSRPHRAIPGVVQGSLSGAERSGQAQIAGQAPPQPGSR